MLVAAHCGTNREPSDCEMANWLPVSEKVYVGTKHCICCFESSYLSWPNVAVFLAHTKYSVFAILPAGSFYSLTSLKCAQPSQVSSTIIVFRENSPSNILRQKKRFTRSMGQCFAHCFYFLFECWFVEFCFASSSKAEFYETLYLNCALVFSVTCF